MEMPLISSSLGYQVKKGEITVDQQGGERIIHASNHSVVSYHAFDIKREEKVEIIQEGSASKMIVYIESNFPTEIKGHLKTNGELYLVNPNGVYLDKDALVEAKSLTLIGSKSLSEDVTQNRSLAPSTGDIVVHGKIKAETKVHLMGKHIVNSGEIHSSQLVRFDHTLSNEQLAILHTGLIQAKEVRFEAKEGICEIYGKINTKNARDGQIGGTISLVAKQIRLIGAYLDASGQYGGGIIKLGTSIDPHKQYVAQRTSIDRESIVDASAIYYGSGGEVMAHSRELTSFNGEIYANGGRNGGDGGLVITASDSQFGIYSGKVSVEAYKGQAGNWLLEHLEKNKLEEKLKKPCLPIKK